MKRLLVVVVALGMSIPLLAQKADPKPPVTPPPSPTYPAPAPAQKSDPTLTQLARDYETAFNKADTNAIMALYTAEALRITPDGRLLTGREAIGKSYAEALAGPFKGAKLTLQPGVTRTLPGNVALIEGTYEVAGSGAPIKGRYLNTVIRGEGGTWRLASVVTVPEASPMAK